MLFDKANPQNPINRRISIVVMTSEAEAAALNETGTLPLPAPAAPAAPAAIGGDPVTVAD